MVTWTPDGSVGHFFATLAPYGPPRPPGASSPLEWGSEEYLGTLFGGGVDSLRADRESIPWSGFAEPGDLPAYYKAHFGPVIATYAHLADDPERTADLDRDFLAYAQRANRAEAGAPLVFDLDYLLTVMRRRA